MNALEHISGNLFIDISQELDEVRTLWERIVKDDLFEYYAHNTPVQIPLVHWSQNLNDLNKVYDLKGQSHTIIGIDGSQIYPDRHQGATCFLINTGTVVIKYDRDKSCVTFETEPHVFSAVDDNFSGCPIDFVNCKREEFEFLKGLEIARSIILSKTHNEPLLVMFDGSLIFWHLDSKDEALRMIFLNKYCTILQELAQLGVLCAFYISFPKNKDLVNLVRFGKSIYEKTAFQSDTFNHVSDVHVAKFFLEPFTRSTIFKTKSVLSTLYPTSIKPCFFYLNVGAEIVRVEIPSWIAEDQDKTDFIAAMVLDNAGKGNGYPVVLAEAHEQAVVKGPDRDFFYHLIQKIGLSNNRNVVISPKSLKKRVMDV